MKKIECLAPAGTMAALKAAIYAGADAIYCGGSQFGARAFAGNFNHAEIEEAVHLCHTWGVKLYITMNTLLYENEFEDAMKEVDFYYSIQVDALIIQDLGLFDQIRKFYPDFELHCSTQMHIHNTKGVEVMRDLGASRIVLARETPLHIVNECCKLGIEIEVFCYGALCVSYSGQCLMSSLLSNRSGNRGECAQYCRMQYDLVNETTQDEIRTEGNYLLSPKDFNVIDEIPKLIESGVSSLKIEGRMKRPEYVYLVTKTIREAIDAYTQNKKYVVSQDRLEELKLMFNRGFTKGHLFSEMGSNLMNSYRPNHIGVVLGKVVQANRQGFSIELERDLNQQDGLRILDDREDLGLIANKILLNNRLVNHASAGQIVQFEDSRFVEKGSTVVKTTDSKLMNQLEMFPIVRKVELELYVKAKLNEPLHLSASDGTHTVEVFSTTSCQKPLNAPIVKERLFEQLLKLNEPMYRCSKIEGECEAFFMPLKEINETRRRLIEKINKARLTSFKRHRIPYSLTDVQFHLEGQGWIEINSIDQAQAVSYTKFPLCTSNPAILNAFPNILALTLVVNENSNYSKDRPLIVSECGGLSCDNKCYATHHFNVTNSFALEFLYKMGIQYVELSYECQDEHINMIEKAFIHRVGIAPQMGVLSFGRRDLMISKTCVVNNSCKDGSKKNCNLCKENRFSLRDKKENYFPCFGDAFCIQHILESKPFTNISKENKNQIIRLTIEDSTQIQELLESL